MITPCLVMIMISSSGRTSISGNDVARLLGAVDGDDPLAAALLHPVIVDVRALPEAALGDDEQRRVALDDDHADDGIALAQLDALHAGRVAAHLAHVHLVEADGQAVRVASTMSLDPARHLDVDQLVVRARS